MSELLPPFPIDDYDTMPFPVLNDRQLRAIVARHGLPVGDSIERMATGGVVHALWAMGDRYVLRVPKDEEMCLGDLRAEVVAIPIARASGVRTPDLIAFDDACDIVPVPYAIVERVHGVDLGRFAVDDSRLDGLYCDLGKQLAVLHAGPVPEPHPWFRVDALMTPEPWLSQCVEAGMLGSPAASWLAGLLADLPHESERRCFLHNDLKPDNVMIDSLGQSVLIDWGDAGIGDPALDFGVLPMTAMAQAFDGYRAVLGADVDETLEQRAVHQAICRAVYGLRRSPLRGPSWYRPVAASLSDLFAYATDHPATWQRLLDR